MQTFLTITSIILGFLSGIIFLFDWMDLVTRWQLRANSSDRDGVLRNIDRFEEKFEKNVAYSSEGHAVYAASSLYGLFAAQKVNSTAYDKLHQALRKSFDLEELSVLRSEGLIDRDKVLISFDQMRNKIIERKENSEIRDLKMFSFWVLFAAAVTGIVAVLL